MMTSDMPAGLSSLGQINLDQYRLFVEHAREVFFQTDMEGVLMFLNPAWEKITGFSVAKSIGTSLFAYVYPNDRQRFKNLFHAIISGRQSPNQRYELRCLTSDQQFRWLQVDLRIDRTPMGLITGVSGTLSDISDRKQYEAAAHLLQTLIQAITEAPDFNTALQVTLYQVCEVTRWNYGEVWVRAGDSENLHLSPIWYGKTTELSIFRQLSQAYVLPIDNSLPGRVWLTQRAEWIPDVSQLSIQEFSRAAIAQEAGLRANFCVPIVANGETLAVLSFFMLSAHPENQHQIELVTAVAQQLGSVIQIKRTEDALHEQQRQSEQLLLNILPAPIAERLKHNNHRSIADSFAEVTVMFADLVNFSTIADHTPPQALVELLNHIFSTFDHLAAHHGLEKIKTIGDAYMVAGGLPIPRPDHAEAIADMALSMQQATCALSQETGEALSLRIGIHTGSVVAGVIGITKFSYDLWGDAVNIASRMESQGLPGQIQVSAAVYDRLHEHYSFQERGVILVKGKGEMMTYLLQGKK